MRDYKCEACELWILEEDWPSHKLYHKMGEYLANGKSVSTFEAWQASKTEEPPFSCYWCRTNLRGTEISNHPCLRPSGTDGFTETDKEWLADMKVKL